MNRFGAMHPRIKPIATPIKMVGPALTVRTRPADNLMAHYATHIAMPGDVLVIDAGGLETNSIWGGLMTHTAKKKGLAGVVIDGAVRDSATIRQLGYPIFARAVSPMNGHKDGPGEVNVIIQCGGVQVKPGDIIVGDDDGVVVVPREDAEIILEKALGFAAKTEKRTKEIQSGSKLVPTEYFKELEEKGIIPKGSTSA
jgi:4-hydroxy-4-methyl-2-oxoglutarate aldolase